MTIEMREFSGFVLWMASFALPYLTFIYISLFGGKQTTILGAIVAVVVGWAYIVAYSIAANSMSIVTLSMEKQQIVYPSGDGAKLGFAMTFGWILPIFAVIIAWLIHLKNFVRKPTGKKFRQSDDDVSSTPQ